MKIHNLFLRALVAITLTYASNASPTTEPNGGFLCPTDSPGRTSMDICVASSLDHQTITGCVQDSPNQSTPSGYNWAACSCTSLSQYSSCMDLWCPAQVTQDVLGPMSYYCGLATGGSQSYPIAATATAAAIATGTGAGTSPAIGSSSGAKPGGAATLESPLSIGAGIIAAFGILAVLL